MCFILHNPVVNHIAITTHIHNIQRKLTMKNYLTQIANFAVTYKCNSRCQNCNIWQTEPKNELSLSEIREFFESNRELFRYVKSIQLTGGEPYLRDDLPEIANTVVENIPGCMVWIPTNGMMPDLVKNQTAKMLSEGVKLGVTVSIDGIAAVNDKIRGVEGSYKLARRTLSHLSVVKKAQPRLDLSVGMTLTPENFKEAPIIQRIAYNRDADFSFRPVNISDFYYMNEEAGQIDPVELEKVLRMIVFNAVNHKGRLGALTQLHYINGVQSYLDGNRELPCTACTSSFFLNPSGDVYPCLLMESKLGNIRDDPFSSIWTSSRAREARDTISKLQCPTCWVECEAYREIKQDKTGLLKTLIRSYVNPNGVV